MMNDQENEHNKISKNNSKTCQNVKIDLIRALINETRISIVMYLLIYQKLTLDDLKQLLNKKAKSTIFHHIKILQNAGIVKEKGTKEGTKIKYYEIVKLQLENLSIDKELDLGKKDLKVDNQIIEYLKAAFELFRVSYKIIDQSFNLAVDYHRKKIKEFEDRVEKKEIVKINPKELVGTALEIRFMTEKKFEIFKNEYKEFQERLKEKLDDISNKEDSEKEQGNEVVSFILTIPLKKYIDEKYKKESTN